MSWEQLQGILKENKTTKIIENREPPVACPFDGAVLDIHPHGKRNCPMGNYTWAGELKLL
jgi:hypothetical protein